MAIYVVECASPSDVLPCVLSTVVGGVGAINIGKKKGTQQSDSNSDTFEDYIPRRVY